MIKFVGRPPKSMKTNRETENWLERVSRGLFRDTQTETVYLYASPDPSDPEAGTSKMWVSDGSGSFGEGDLCIKITDSGGTTKSTTIVDYSAI